MKVVVAYNDDLELKPHLNEFEKIGEEEVVGTAKEVAESIGGTLLPVRDVRTALDQLRRDKPDIVFNLCEGVMGVPRWEMHFALALEMLAIPFTGCDPIATGICGDKWLTKGLLAAAGIAVPRGFVVRELSELHVPHPVPSPRDHLLPRGEGSEVHRSRDTGMPRDPLPAGEGARSAGEGRATSDQRSKSSLIERPSPPREYEGEKVPKADEGAATARESTDDTNVTRRSDTPAEFRTWIVKPSLEDAGIGIDREAICRTEAEIRARCAHVLATYRQPALVEEFIDGRELNQALFYGSQGLTILPPGEIVFADELPPDERIVGWKAKWADGSAEDRATANRTPAVTNDTLRSELAVMCAAAASVLSLHGYCRFDVRQRPSGELCVIDVNPNPDIGRNTGFRKALAAAGIEFSDFLSQLMTSALSSKRA